jgi:plastocyanin
MKESAMSRFPPTAAGRAALALALSIFVFGVASFKALGAVPRIQIVAIKNFAFVPQTITVSPGTTVTWTNADEDPHTVTANDKSFHSSALDTDDKYSFTFTRPGEFGYFCSLHPHMTARVIVKSS